MRRSQLEYEGDLSVLTNIGVASYGDTSIRAGLLAMPGMLRGVSAAGLAKAAFKKGLSRGISVFAGASAGTFPILYMMSRQIGIGCSIFHEECCTPEFFSLMRLPWGNAVGINVIANAMRHAHKALDETEVFVHPAKVIFVLTDVETGEEIILDAKEVAKRTGVDLVSIACASATPPGLSLETPTIDGRRVFDGLQLPIQKIVESENLTDVLIFANRPKVMHESPITRLVGRVMGKIVLAKYTNVIRERIANSDRAFDTDVKWLPTSGRRYLIIWSDPKIGPFTQHARILQMAIEKEETYMIKLIERSLR